MWGRRHDIAGTAIAVLLLVAALTSWQHAERYRHTFRLKRAAAGLKHDDSVIRYLQHGHGIALGIAVLLAAVFTGRVVHGRRRRNS